MVVDVACVADDDDDDDDEDNKDDKGVEDDDNDDDDDNVNDGLSRDTTASLAGASSKSGLQAGGRTYSTDGLFGSSSSPPSTSLCAPSG